MFEESVSHMLQNTKSWPWPLLRFKEFNKRIYRMYIVHHILIMKSTIALMTNILLKKTTKVCSYLVCTKSLLTYCDAWNIKW